MIFSNFMNSLLTNLRPQKFKVSKNFDFEINVQKLMSSLIPNRLRQMRAQN